MKLFSTINLLRTEILIIKNLWDNSRRRKKKHFQKWWNFLNFFKAGIGGGFGGGAGGHGGAEGQGGAGGKPGMK